MATIKGGRTLPAALSDMGIWTDGGDGHAYPSGASEGGDPLGKRHTNVVPPANRRAT